MSLADKIDGFKTVYSVSGTSGSGQNNGRMGQATTVTAASALDATASSNAGATNSAGAPVKPPTPDGGQRSDGAIGLDGVIVTANGSRTADYAAEYQRWIYPEWQHDFRAWDERRIAAETFKELVWEAYGKPALYTAGGMYFGAVAADIMSLNEGVGAGTAVVGDVVEAVPAFARSQYGRVPSIDRTAALDKSPICPYCGRSPSTQVDHITALKQDWQSGGWADSYVSRTARVNSSDNLIGACASSNASKGARQIGQGQGQWQPPGWQVGESWPYGGH